MTLAEIIAIANEDPTFITSLSSNEVWYGNNTNIRLTDVLAAIAQEAQNLNSSKANANHTHSGYAAAEHTHSGYATTDALAGKADASHTHTGFAAASHTHTGYAASSHSHAQSDVEGLAGALSGKANAQHTHGTADVTGLATALEGKADADHTHNYAASGHTHTPASIGAAASSHSHSAATTSAAGLMSAADKSKLDGIATGANKYTHPAYTAKSSGLYKVTVDATGHVSAATAVTKADITALGIPGSDTNTTYSAATTSAAGLMSAADKTKLDGIATGANKTTVDSALSSTSTNPVQNKVINSALAGKAASSHTHSDYFSVNGGTINGETNVAGVLRVNGQQSFYYQTSTASQTVGTNNATGGTTICCGPSANVYVNGASLMTPNCLPRTNNAYYCGNANFRWKGIYSAAAVNVSSDERLKRDISRMDNEALADFIGKLNVVSYNYKDDEAGAKARIGLVAQDVQKADAGIAKFFVDEDEAGMLGLTPANLVFPLIAAVQQLSKRVAELEGK